MPKRVLLAAVSVCFALTIVTCSKAKGPTSPGGGGGAAPVFNLSFTSANAMNEFTFMTPGTWDYHCTPHQGSGMTGTVIVSASATLDLDTVAVGRDAAYAQAFRFKPSTVTIRPGGVVRWVNRSSMNNHTVTRP